MAMFREHVAAGAIVSMAVVVAVYFYALITDPWLLAILFAVTVIASFLPDVDSDSGLPFYFVYGTATLVATGVVLLYTLSSEYAGDWRYLVGIPLAALAFIWFVIGGVVKRCTKHRGIFHSIPALLIAAAGTFLIARYLGFDDAVSIVFAAAVGVGFLSHLILDEMHSLVDLEGIPFIPKQSLGTALKLFSSSNRVNIATYILLAALIYSALQTPQAQAYYNDSNVIELTGEPPPEEEEQGGDSGGGGDEGGGEQSSGAGGTGGSGSSGSAGGSSGGSGSSGGDGTGEGGATEDDVIETLLGNSAFEGMSGFSDSRILSGEGSGGEGTFRISGDRVRSILSNRTDLRDVLASWRNLRGVNGASAREYGLMAASTALGDANVQEISFSANAFEIKYRSRGYLLAVIPWTFPVRVVVVPKAAEGNRVSVHLPWYRFFVREFFTPSRLASDIESTMKATAAEAPPDTDQNALLFEAVANHLRQRVGTEGSSVILGTE